MYFGSCRQEPFRWREPLYQPQRCPKCHARLIVSPVEERCPYCDYRKHKALPLKERTPPAVLPSVRHQIQEAIGEAGDGTASSATKFTSYELPRAQNFERMLFVALFVVMLILLRLGWAGHRRDLFPDDAPLYIFLAVFLPSIFFLFVLHTTFLTPKLIAVGTGLAVAGVGLYVNMFPQAVPELWVPHVARWVSHMLVHYQIVAGLWAASIAWRDWQQLRR